MRILYLTNGFPYPLTSGYLRHYFFIRGLSSAHRVTLLSLVGRRFEPDDVAGLAPFAERLEVFGASGGRRRSVLSRAGRKLAALSAADLPTGAVRDMRSWAVRLHAEAPFDVVFVSGKGTYSVIDAMLDVPLVADL